MSKDSKIYLAASVLNDGHIVSYRALGRQLKVHNNIAKKMLFEFYTTQRTGDFGSIDATYLLNGVPKAPKVACVNGYQKDGKDEHLHSSPYMGSSALHPEDQEEAVPSRIIVLAREEDLQAAKTKFKQIHSIHIYSLGPSRMQNLQILSDCNRAISVEYANDDPLVFQDKYGSIHTAGVRRRTPRQPPIGVPPIPAETVNERVSSKNEGIHKEQENDVNSFDRSLSSDRSKRSNKSVSSATVASETVVKGTGNVEAKPASQGPFVKTQPCAILKSFPRPKPSVEHKNTGTSVGASLVPSAAPLEPKGTQEDQIMRDASEDEQDDDFISSNSVNARIPKSESERAEQLRKMMEDEDQAMEDTGNNALQSSQKSETVHCSLSQKRASPGPPIAVTEGRRRGRRKVIKKKTMRDEEGYLVTKEEPVWESFSEEEPAQRQKMPASNATSSMGKGKKASGKPGQGSIMSFFGKK